MAKAKAKKATKNRVDQEVKPMDQDPLQKFDRLGGEGPRCAKFGHAVPHRAAREADEHWSQGPATWRSIAWR